MVSFSSHCTGDPFPKVPFSPHCRGNHLPGTPSHLIATETPSQDPLLTSLHRKPFPRVPFSPHCNRDSFPWSPSHLIAQETLSTGPLLTSMHRRTHLSAPFSYYCNRSLPRISFSSHCIGDSFPRYQSNLIAQETPQGSVPFSPNCIWTPLPKVPFSPPCLGITRSLHCLGISSHSICPCMSFPPNLQSHSPQSRRAKQVQSSFWLFRQFTCWYIGGGVDKVFRKQITSFRFLSKISNSHCKRKYTTTTVYQIVTAKCQTVFLTFWTSCVNHWTSSYIKYQVPNQWLFNSKTWYNKHNR